MEEWKEYKLGEICEFQNGYAFKSTDFVDSGDNRVVKIKELKDGGVKFFNDSSYISCDDDEIRDKFAINYLDVLFALTGDPVNKPNPLSWVGRVSLYKYKETSLMNQRVCKTLPSEKIDNLFLYYYFRQPDVFYQLASKATGSASQANISTKTIADVCISLPPLPEQKGIVSVLKSLDDKIEVNRRINENLEKQAQVLFKSWFVDFGPFKDGEFVESELGMIPKGWRVGKLDEIIKENPKSTIQVKQARDIKGRYPFFTSGSSILEFENFLVSGRNLFLNTGGVAGVKFYIGDAAYSTDTWCIKGVHDYSDFLYLYLSRIENLINTQYFEGSALKHLKKKALKERMLIIPTIDVISVFNKIVKPIYNKKMDNIIQSRRLVELRDTLLPKLMSGELKVNEVEI